MRIYINGFLEEQTIQPTTLKVPQGNTPRVDVSVYALLSDTDLVADMSAYTSLTFSVNAQVVTVPNPGNKTELTLTSTMTETVSDDGLDWELVLTGPSLRDTIAFGKMIVENSPSLEPVRDQGDYPPIVLPSDVYQDLVNQLQAGGTWTTGTAYNRMALVEHDGSTYLVTEAHTSGVFADDLAAGNLQLMVQGASGGGGGLTLVSEDTGSNVVSTDAKLIVGALGALMAGRQLTLREGFTIHDGIGTAYDLYIFNGELRINIRSGGTGSTGTGVELILKSDGGFEVGPGNATVLRVDPLGRIGINQQTPNATLEVNHDGTTAPMTLFRNGDTQVRWTHDGNLERTTDGGVTWLAAQINWS